MIFILIYGYVNGRAVTAVTNYAKRPQAWRAALEFVSEEILGDGEVVLVAVGQCGAALKHASEELRADPFVRNAAGDDVGEEELYLTAYEELKNDEYDKTIFGKVLAEADGNIEEAKKI